MVSHTSPAAGAHGAPARGIRPGSGMVTFAAVMLFILAFFNGLEAIAAIVQSHVFVAGAHIVIGDLRAWGWTLLALAILQAVAAFSVLAGGQTGRWFGVAVLSVNAFAHMWVVSAYPFWSLVIIVFDIVAIYALCAYGGRPEKA
jgi:hypothetical protein